MTEKKFKRVCECQNCGNEAEMMITCSLEVVPQAPQAAPGTAPPKAKGQKTKGHAVCSHCGSEADIWLDL